MSHWTGVRRIFRLDSGDVRRSVQDELQFHFDMKVEDLMRKGLDPDDARLEAERQFGDVSGTRNRLATIDRSRAGRIQWNERLSNLAQDVRYAVRGMRLKPAFTIGVILTLGLGIGANATMFGIVDHLLLRPPAFLRDPGTVNRIFFMRTLDGQLRPTANIAYTRYLDVSAGTSTVAEVAAFSDENLAMGTGQESRERRVLAVSASFWSFFAMRAEAGRFFAPDEDRVPMGAKVAVLGYGFWRSTMGGRGDVLGRPIRIGRADYTVIGVAPRGFQGVGLQQPDAYIPITTFAAVERADVDEQIAQRNAGPGAPPVQRYYTVYNWSWMEMLVRRKPGASVAATEVDLTAAYRRSYLHQATLQRSLTPIAQVRPHIVVSPIQRERGPQQRPESKVTLWLIGVSLIVLIIACANVGNLLLARAFQRRREIAVRLALGISRKRLLGQLLIESLVLALSGGVAALAFTEWGGGLLRATLLPDVAWSSTLRDGRVLAFTAFTALVSGVVAALAPAFQAGRSDVAQALRSGVREGTHQRSRTRTALLVLQGALSVVLLVGAGLFVRSFQNVRTMRLGYDAGRMLYLNTEMRGVTLPATATIALKRHLLDAARALPGTERASRNVSVPFWSTEGQDLHVAGIDSVEKLGEFDLQAVSSDYFATTGTRILRGRPITDADRAGSLPVIVVSQSMARVLWHEADPLTKCVRVGADTMPCRQVVGVAEDIKAASLKDDPGLLYYVAIDQYAPDEGGLYVRTRGTADSRAAESVRRSLQPLMPGAAYINVLPLASILHPEMRAWEIGATMFTVFGALALLVAIVGLYSVVAYGVVQRSHEMGVRLALGAQMGDVVGLVLWEGVRIALVSVAIGTALALVAARWVAPLLFNVSPRDPVTIGGVAVVLLGVSAIASVIPALRAARVDPNVALRAE